MGIAATAEGRGGGQGIGVSHSEKACGEGGPGAEALGRGGVLRQVCVGGRWGGLSGVLEPGGTAQALTQRQSVRIARE